MIDLAIGPKLFVTNVLDEAIQELDILFSTEPGEVIGDFNYGANWHQFLQILTPMESSLRRYIEDLIRQRTFYCNTLHYNINVEYIPGEVSSAYLVHIDVIDPDSPQDSPNHNKNKTYIIR